MVEVFVIIESGDPGFGFERNVRASARSSTADGLYADVMRRALSHLPLEDLEVLAQESATELRARWAERGERHG